MDYFQYRDGKLFAEDLAVTDIAKQIGTPCYVYSRATLERHWNAFDQAFGDYPHLVCYAVKANSNLAVLNLLARLGSGFDIVSAGELTRVLTAGGDASKVVFSGVAKTEVDIEYALQQGIRSINVESIAELQRIQKIAKTIDKVAPIAIRVNPDVDAQTHPYIATGLEQAKFGIAMDAALETYRQAATMSHIEIHGIACHIGSQITTNSPFIDALDKVLELVNTLKAEDISIQQLDLGGGLGICYQDETPPQPSEYVAALMSCIKKHNIALPIAIEPGRAIAGNAGILLTKVEFLKSNSSKSFAIVDAGMNDLMRPSLYQAWHNIIPIDKNSSATTQTYDVVGPVCETGDILGKGRSLKIQQGDLLAIRSAGAYGWVMASNYNSRPRPPEIMIDGEQLHIVRSRETTEQLMCGEAVLP